LPKPVCADTAATEYFSVDTGHARKLHGVDMGDILPNFFAKAVQLFNMRDTAATLVEPSLLGRVLDATFDASQQKPLLAECLGPRSGVEVGEPRSQNTLLMGLSPHERAVLLAQAVAGIVLFLHRLASSQWAHKDYAVTLTEGAVVRALDEIWRMGRDKTSRLLETIEASTIFTMCPLKKAIADLIARAVENADGTSKPDHHRGAPRTIIVEDESDSHEISLSFVNDKGPEDVVLPCGLTILPLN
jgi:hypothetical protein